MSSLEDITERFKKHSDILKEEVMRTTGSSDPDIQQVQKFRENLSAEDEVEQISLDEAHKLMQAHRGSNQPRRRGHV